MKPNINSVEVHPQLSNNGHPVDDALVGWFSVAPNVSNMEHSVSLTGEFSPNFDLKNMISTYTKDFSWKKKRPKFADFEDVFNKSPDFYNKFQQVAKNMKGLRIFFYFHI